MRYIFKFFLCNVFGWKAELKEAPIPPKCVVIVAPHTSAWDFILGYAFGVAKGIPFNFLIKEEFFFFPVGPIIKAMGAIPVNRKKNILAKQLVTEFSKRKKLPLIITIEGTRKKTKNWKKGYSMIAKAAQVPIMVGKLDYGKKTMTVKEVYEHDDERIHDMDFVKSLYNGISAKFPEHFTNN